MDHRQSHASQLAKQRLERHSARAPVTMPFGQPWSRGDPEHEIQLWAPAEDPKSTTAGTDFREWPLKPAVNRPAAHEAGFADQRALTGASTAATSFPQWELPARRVAPAPDPSTQRQQQTGGDEWLTSSGETYVTHPIPASRGKARREFVQNEHAQGRRASTLQQVAAVDRFDGTTENTQNYVMHPLQSAAERQARGRAAAEAADQRGPLPHNVPFDSDTSYRTDFTPMRRDVAVPVGTPLALGVQLQSHGGATFYCMLTPRMQSSSAKVTTVTHGQRAVQVRVVASPAVSAVHQMVTVESPLLLLDEFELPGVAPAPAGTAELLLTFELARRDAGKSLLTVTCADMRNAGGEKNISIALHQSGAPQQS